MILKKEFYFVRHGQTDYNISLIKINHADVPLNATGRKQALSIAPSVNRLPFKTICCSPLKRAKETKELLVPDQNHEEIEDLSECTSQIWGEMTSLGSLAFDEGSLVVKNFLERAKNGIHQALKNEGPVLIVAHGGIHWAICYWMNIQEHNWIVDNCRPVHFFINEANQWKAKYV